MTSKLFSRSFGRHLKALRLKRNLSQEELGERAKLSRNFVGMIERGERSVSLETLDSLARALDIEKSIQQVTDTIKRHSEAEKGYYELGIDIFELAQQAAQIFAESSPEKQRKLLSLVCEEIYVTDNRLVVKFSEAFNVLAYVFSNVPAGSKSLKTIPSPYQIFELSKDGSIKARKDVTDAGYTGLLRG